VVPVERQDLLDGHADGEAGGDDRARARPADVVEPVAEDEVGIAGLRSQLRLELGEDRERDHAADPAAVEAQQPSRAGFAVPCRDHPAPPEAERAGRLATHRTVTSTA
jgi:hypothetical protein